MPRFKLLIEYAGTRYSGWQIQKNARTVAGEIDRAVREATRRNEFELYGAGRTDAGVHAVGQVAHLDIYTDIAPGTLRARINDALPSDIYIRAIDKVPHRFHARHDARQRSYVYQISRRKTAFLKPYVWWIKDRLEVEPMRQAAAAFVGMRNFASFTAEEPDEKSTRVLIDRLEIADDGDLILIRIAGSHFLWRMVRRIVGVLAAVGRGDLAPDAVSGFLEERSEIPATLTAPASGLFLEAVFYGEHDRAGELRALPRVGRAEDGGRRTEDRGRRTDGGGRTAEDRGRRTEARDGSIER
jgi:tRNA pseudouridine38-40 synthase